jgi:hypothetical protein
MESSKSSCICPLPTYQGALVAMRRHLDSKTCSFRTWLRAADLQIGHGTDELLVEQQSVSDGQTAFPVKEGAKHAQSFSCILSHLDCETWLWQPYRLCNALSRRGGQVWVIRLHTGWSLQGRRVHPEPSEPACTACRRGWPEGCL